MPADDVKFVLRVPKELYADLQAVAKSHEVSLNRLIVGRILADVRVTPVPPKETQPLVRKSVRLATGESRNGTGHCPTHNKQMKDYGTKWMCEGPPMHTVMK